MGKTNKFDIDILDNEDPVIEIEGAKDGDEFGGDSLPTITATASDDYGIGKFEYYLDGELIETAPEGEDTIVATFEDARGGEHEVKFVCEDIYGVTVTKTIYINFVVDKTFITYETDFEKFNGSAFDGFSLNTNSHGRFEPVTVDEEYGTSLGIVLPEDVDESGEKANWNTNGGNTAWLGIPINNVTTPVDVDFDFNISTRPAKYNEEYGWQTTHDDFMRFCLRTNGEINFMRIRPDKFETAQTYQTPTSAYETGKWYHATISMHADGGTFKVVIIDKQSGNVVIECDGKLDSPVSQLRLFQAYHAESAGTFAIDNIAISSSFGMPEFVAGNEGIVGGTNEFTLKLTESLLPADVTADTLTITNEFGKVKVKKAVLTASDLVVTTESPVIGNMDYTFSLPKTTRFTTGDEVGFVIENTLTTLPGSFEISDGNLGTAAFQFNALNTTGAPKNITLIFQTWNDDGQVTAVSAVTKEIAANTSPQNYIIFHKLDVANDETLTAYVWDGYSKPAALTPVVYTAD